MGLQGVDAVTFPTTDGLTLNGWFVNRTPNPEAVVLVFNGNAGNRAHRASFADALARLGSAVFIFDYRGYGDNPGSPSENGLRMDARAARSYLLSRSDVDPKALVYFGESLGTAVAVELASEHPPAGLILRSPFTSLTALGRHHYGLPVGWILRDRYATLDRMSNLRTPLLVIAGDSDRIVPFSESRQVFDAANEPKSLLVIPNADHNDAALFEGRTMIEGIVRFLRNLR
ncbi:MAG: alpha/beta hydrolase [Acidobacteria bacterium]|nr:MAG: alpha/beta hydrolase [Acidobacteriota bacterium]